jgi:3-oxo-5-alpha-steroid 4-dehydrogenase 1
MGWANGLSIIQKSQWYSLHGWIFDSRLWIGGALFIIGFWMHAHSDALLRRLRREGRGEYSIPEQGMFRYVASPNYLGEIMEWAGWAIATWSLAGTAFLIFTVANLLPRAFSHFSWYRRTFSDFPTKRRVLIPFIW